MKSLAFDPRDRLGASMEILWPPLYVDFVMQVKRVQLKNINFWDPVLIRSRIAAASSCFR